MAIKNLKTLKFPGLNDTYSVENKAEQSDVDELDTKIIDIESSISDIENSIDNVNNSIQNSIKTLRKKILPITGYMKKIEQKGGRVSNVSETVSGNDKYFTANFGSNSVAFSILKPADPLPPSIPDYTFGGIRYLRGYGTVYNSHLYLLRDYHYGDIDQASPSDPMTRLVSIDAQFYFDGIEIDCDEIQRDMEFTTLTVKRQMVINTNIISQNNSSDPYVISETPMTLTIDHTHVVNNSGIQCFIETNWADWAYARIYTNGSSPRWSEIYGSQDHTISIYQNNINSKILTMHRDEPLTTIRSIYPDRITYSWKLYF